MNGESGLQKQAAGIKQFPFESLRLQRFVTYGSVRQRRILAGEAEGRKFFFTWFMGSGKIPPSSRLPWPSRLVTKVRNSCTAGQEEPSGTYRYTDTASGEEGTFGRKRLRPWGATNGIL